MPSSKKKKNSMKKFKSRVDNVLQASDIVLEVLDARFIESTRNEILERRIDKLGLKLILVLNKSDLISKSELNKALKSLKNETVVFTTCTDFKGIGPLRNLLKKLGKDSEVHIGVVGFPNTGKSSLINMLAGRHAAGTSPIAGHTKGEQWVRIHRNVMLLDTPGVVDKVGAKKAVFLGGMSPNKVKDPELVALEIIDYIIGLNKQVLERAYNILIETKDSEQVLEDICIIRNRLTTGNEPDTKTMARMIIQDWQRGKLKL